MTDIAYIGYIAEDKRWRATITYAVTDTETRAVVHDVMELKQLHDLVERGPTFCAIRDFKIEYLGPKETIKQARES